MRCTLAKQHADEVAKTNTTTRSTLKMIKKLILMRLVTKMMIFRLSKSRRKKKRTSEKWSLNPPRNNKKSQLPEPASSTKNDLLENRKLKEKQAKSN
jgi:hypothetical protein